MNTNIRSVALVTGSASGIGAAVARRFSAAGMRVVINSVRSTQAGEELASELPDAIYVQGDVANVVDARRIVDETVATYGRLDILVNNAGTTRFIPLDDLETADAEAWRAVLDVNVIGTWQVTTAAVPHLRATGSGAIVNVSSIAGTVTFGSSAPYCVSKAAMNHMTRLLAATLGPEIRVNAVAPGPIDTPWNDKAPETDEEADEWIRTHTLLRRMGTAEEVAEAVLALVQATYTTGDIMTLDGGVRLL